MQDKNEQLAPWRVLVLYKSARLRLAETSTRPHRNQRKRKIPSREVAESPAEPLGRTSAITLGGFLDRFRFWPFAGAPSGEIVSLRIITISLRVWFGKKIIKTRQLRKLTNPIPMCYPVYAPWKLWILGNGWVNFGFVIEDVRKYRSRKSILWIFFHRITSRSRFQF